MVLDVEVVAPANRFVTDELDGAFMVTLRLELKFENRPEPVALTGLVEKPSDSGAVMPEVRREQLVPAPRQPSTTTGQVELKLAYGTEVLQMSSVEKSREYEPISSPPLVEYR